MERIEIKRGSIDDVVALSKRMPEFDQPHPKKVYEARMGGKANLILIARADSINAGFKVGYDKYGDGSFYTWMGGVLPEFRRKGIARMLALEQERYAQKSGYDSIVLKTRNRHKNMLLFALTSGFNIIELISNEDINENRIILRKPL